MERFENRSRMSLIANILTITNNDQVSKTHLMYRANLSHRMLVTYTRYLVEAGFLVERTPKGSGRMTEYFTSEKGKRYLVVYNSLAELAIDLKRFDSPFSDNKGSEEGRSNDLSLV